MNFEIGEIFDVEYPPDAVAWCNANNAFIEEIEPSDEGVRRFQIVGIPEPTAEELAAQELAQAKAKRADAVSRIIVEVDGMKFDGDEESQTRMGRTIATTVALGVDLTTGKRTWVLADNTIAEVTIAQLAEALRLAGDAQTALWTVPYTDGSMGLRGR
jgi:hypothetical protein